MSDEISQAAGGILAMIFGGVLLLEMAPMLNNPETVNLRTWGTLMIIFGVLCAVLLVYGAFRSLTS